MITLLPAYFEANSFCGSWVNCFRPVHKKGGNIDSMWTGVQGQPEWIWLSHSAVQHDLGLR